MEYRTLGKSGLKVSALSFGSWVTFHNQVNTDLAYELMVLAYESGVNFFDNAEVYADGNSETIMGEVLKRTQWKRSDLVISTKIFWGGNGVNDIGLSRKHIFEGTHAALKRLQLDYVDLLFCHRPDPVTPVEETVWAMHQLIMQGKALYWGTSEWNALQIAEAYNFAISANLIPPLMEQPQYNMFVRDRVEKEYLPLYAKTGLGTTIWSPLASGILSGKYANGIPEGSRLSRADMDWLKKRLDNEKGKEQLTKTRYLQAVAIDTGMTVSQLAIAWCLKNPHVSTVILGASNINQLGENLQALDKIEKLTPEVMARIEMILSNKPVQEMAFRT